MSAPGLEQLVEQLFPGGRLLEAVPLSVDASAAAEGTHKGAGYGLPQRLRVAKADGAELDLVFRVASPNDFGHDRRSDRAGGAVLAFDDFQRMPRHIRALDVGAIRFDGSLVSLRESGEFYLLTSWAPGTLYADDLRRIAREGRVTSGDVARCEALARFLVDLHRRPEGTRPAQYVRAVRDLIGHGEGIYGVIDGYPPDVPGAAGARLNALECRCAEWRWRLRGHEGRLVRTHGDFHPFNVVFDQGDDFTALDASRGALGDGADDVTAMAINYLFFALEHPRSWSQGLGVLWRRFWAISVAHDSALPSVAPPFFAWRALVLANPVFYPALAAEARDRLLGFVEHVLDAGPCVGGSTLPMITSPRGAVVWITGRPASGKSTFAATLRVVVLARGLSCAVLDSDAVREALGAHDYSEPGRRDFYESLGALAALLARQDLIVLVPATAHRRAYREAARARAPRFLEVFVSTPLEECARRDPKGLYARALELPTADYEPPAQPDVVATGGHDERAVADVLVALAR